MPCHRRRPNPGAQIPERPAPARDLLARLEERGLADHGHQVATLAARVCAFMNSRRTSAPITSAGTARGTRTG